MMKNFKILYSLIIVLLIVAIAGVIYFIQSHNEEAKEQESPKYTQVDFLPNLNEASFKDKLNNGEEFNVLIWRPDCGDSQIFIDEFLNYFAEYDEDGNFARLKYNLGDTNFYSLDISEFIGKISDKSTRGHYRDLYGFYFTPSLVHYKDVDDDGKSEVANIAEWDPVYGFESNDYLKWFYDNQLVTPRVEVYHEGQTDKQD
jgi:hypothetical protein